MPGRPSHIKPGKSTTNGILEKPQQKPAGSMGSGQAESGGSESGTFKQDGLRREDIEGGRPARITTWGERDAGRKHSVSSKEKNSVAPKEKSLLKMIIELALELIKMFKGKEGK